MPWAGNPRVNMQNDGGKAKSYQIEQLLEAIDHMEAQRAKHHEHADALAANAAPVRMGSSERTQKKKRRKGTR
jgi:hypothetical protein